MAAEAATAAPNAVPHEPVDPGAASAGGAATRLREDLLTPDPLLDSLVEVCRLHGHHASRASLTAGLPLVGGRLPLALAERAAARFGMATKLQRVAVDAIDAGLLPLVLLLHGNAACVLLGWSAGGEQARVLLPESGQGEVQIARAELDARYAGIALSVRPRFRFDARTPGVRPERAAHWFWGAVLAQRFVYRDILWAAVLINVFALALPFFAMNVYDRVVPNQAIETLWVLAIGVLLVLGADVFMRMLRSRFVDEASARIDVQISATLMERVLGLKLEHRPESVGSFAANLRGFEQVRDFIASSSVTALVDLPFAVLFVLVMAWIAPLLALPVALAFAAVLVVGTVLQHRLHELAEATWTAASQRNATLVESLAGLETIKTQGAQGAIQSRWERANAYIAQLNVRMRALSSSALTSTAWLTQMCYLALIVIGVYLISDRSLTLGGLIAATMLGSRALAPAGQIVGLLMQYQGARMALETLDALMAKPVERPVDQAFIQRPNLTGSIEFRNVRFKYPNREDAALDGISLRIGAGEHVALIGRVGSGKSTIHKLILGLYEPDEGSVLIDGIDARQLDPADLRHNIASVSQDVTLFYGSLRENIAFGLPHADDASIVAAAEAAGLGDFVNRHPRGFHLQVGERGESLSGGQRQGVGVARALLRNAPIVLLDEPTSAMDFTTEAALTQRLREHCSGRTVVLATHRTSLLAMASRVIVIDNGKVVADGPRDAVMEALRSGRIGRAAP